eukprot:g38551.t1
MGPWDMIPGYGRGIVWQWNPPKVDEKEAKENTNVQIGDEEIAEEHKREQSRQAVQRAGLFKTEDSEIKSGSLPMDTEEEPSLKPTEAEEIKGDTSDHKYLKLEPSGKLWFYGQDTGGIKWRQGSFYLMKPNQKSVGDDTLDDLYLLKIPERIWDILLDSDFPFEYVGAPPYDKVTRGKKCRKLKPEKEADTGLGILLRGKVVSSV